MQRILIFKGISKAYDHTCKKDKPYQCTHCNKAFFTKWSSLISYDYIQELNHINGQIVIKLSYKNKSSSAFENTHLVKTIFM